MFWQTKKCSVCSAPITFEFGIFDTRQGEKFDRPQESLFCRAHFLEKIRQELEQHSQPFIFSEPYKEYRKYVQLFYYTTSTLPRHEYSPQDVSDVSHLLDTAGPAGDKSVILLSPEVIKEAYDAPLIKIANPGYSLIDKEGFISLISNILVKYEAKYPKGGFWFCLPYSDRGIYLWFEI